jgi:hypothetical protein
MKIKDLQGFKIVGMSDPQIPRILVHHEQWWFHSIQSEHYYIELNCIYISNLEGKTMAALIMIFTALITSVFMAQMMIIWSTAIWLKHCPIMEHNDE